MANPRRPSYSAAAGAAISLESAQASPAAQAQRSAFSSSSLVHFLKKPHAFPFLLSAFLLLTWIILRLQSGSSYAAASRFSSSRDRERGREEDDHKANLVRFPLGSFSDKRGWLLDPTSVALDSGIRGLSLCRAGLWLNANFGASLSFACCCFTLLLVDDFRWRCVVLCLQGEL